MEKYIILAVMTCITFIFLGAMIEDYNKNQRALACINQGMQWQQSFGGSCKAAEKK